MDPNRKYENIFQTVKDKDLMTLIIARNGGKTTLRILDKLLERPYNKNQLSEILELDYNTISYHINIIREYKYVTEEKFENTYYYFPSKKLYNNLKEYNLIKEFLNTNKE
jgi:DNA-binding transcriptional ArsR family regulator